MESYAESTGFRLHHGILAHAILLACVLTLSGIAVAVADDASTAKRDSAPGEDRTFTPDPFAPTEEGGKGAAPPVDPFTKEPRTPKDTEEPTDAAPTAPGLPGPAGEPEQPTEEPAEAPGVEPVKPPVEPVVEPEQGVFAGGPPIREIAFEGLEHVDQATALEKLGMKVGDAYDPARAEAALGKLLDLGYFRRARADSYVHVEQADDGVRLIFHLTENPPVQAIAFQGNTVLSPEQLTAALSSVISVGDPYNEQLSDPIGEAIAGAYWDAGFLAIVLPHTLSADGTLTVPVIEQYIEEVRVEGLRKTKRGLVMDEIHTAPGHLYDVGQIRQDLDRLTDLGVFETVALADPVPGSQAGALIITYEVNEAKTGVFDVGAGYGPKDGFTGYAAIAERNLGGRGRRIGVRAEFGGTYDYAFEYADPFLDSHHTSVELCLYARRTRTDLAGLAGLVTANQAFANETHAGGVISLVRPLDTDRKRSLSLTYLNEYVSNMDPRLLNLLEPSALRGRVGKVSVGLVNDSRDDVLIPARGGRESIGVEQSAGLLGSDFTFTKLSLDLRRYYPLGERGTIALRGAYGHGRGDIPVFEAFTMGGHDTIRGYREDRFAGTNMLLLNAEYRYRLFGREPSRSLQAIAFADYGDAFGGRWAGQGGATFYPEHQAFAGALGVGVGLRWYTKYGPFGVDYGVGREGGRGYVTFRQTF